MPFSYQNCPCPNPNLTGFVATNCNSIPRVFYRLLFQRQSSAEFVIATLASTPATLSVPIAAAANTAQKAVITPINKMGSEFNATNEFIESTDNSLSISEVIGVKNTMFNFTFSKLSTAEAGVFHDLACHTDLQVYFIGVDGKVYGKTGATALDIRGFPIFGRLGVTDGILDKKQDTVMPVSVNLKFTILDQYWYTTDTEIVDTANAYAAYL
jgi:hypothetical protein